jgi:hypothetical protein
MTVAQITLVLTLALRAPRVGVAQVSATVGLAALLNAPPPG